MSKKYIVTSCIIVSPVFNRMRRWYFVTDSDNRRTLASYRTEKRALKAMKKANDLVDNDKGPECTVCKGACKKDHG